MERFEVFPWLHVNQRWSINIRCFEYKKDYKKDFINILLKKLQTHKFCDGNINKSILLLRKGVYAYEYMDSWKTFDETSLPDKKIVLVI